MIDSTYKDFGRLIVWFHCVLLELLPPDRLNHRIVGEVFSSYGFLVADVLKGMGLMRALWWATNLCVEAMIQFFSFTFILCLPVWLLHFLCWLLIFCFTHHFPIHQPLYFYTGLLSIQLRSFYVIGICNIFLSITSALLFRQWPFPASFTLNLALRMFDYTSNKQDSNKGQTNNDCHWLEVRDLLFFVGLLWAGRFIRSFHCRSRRSLFDITTHRVTKSKEQCNSYYQLFTRNFHLFHGVAWETQ